MKIDQAYQRISELLPTAKRKSEIKLVQSLLEALNSLGTRDFSTEQLQSIEGALEQLLPKKNGEVGFKQLKRGKKQFMRFLKERLSLVPSGHYLELGTALGMAFGASFGMLLQDALSHSTSLAVGVAVGAAIGMIWGAAKDREAVQRNGVL